SLAQRYSSTDEERASEIEGDLQLIVTEMPLSTPLPEGSSMNVGGESTLVLAPGELLATDMRVPTLPCPQPCGIDTTPGFIASVISTGTLISPASDFTVTMSLSAMPQLAASMGWISSVHRSLPFISAGTLCNHVLFDRRCLRLTRTSGSAGRSMR